MDKYEVKLSPRAYRDLDKAYYDIAHELQSPQAAEDTLNAIESAILSLEEMPYRGSKRQYGYYADKAYRQIFVGHYTIVYRIESQKQRVIVVTVAGSATYF